MEGLLQSNATSVAFKEYAPAPDEDSSHVKLHAILQCNTEALLRARGQSAMRESSQRGVQSLQCTGVSWNSTGSTLAASYGRLNVAGWCNEPGALACWNAFKRSSSADEAATLTPDVVFDHSSYLMCLCCHPTHPAIVAAGSFNGEVLVWNTAADDPLLGVSQIDDYFHREPVTQVAWVYDMDEQGEGYRLVSTSGDGKILCWSLRNRLAYPVEGYALLTAPAGNRRVLISKLVERPLLTIPMSSSALSFFSEGKLVSSLVVGSEAGALVKCTLPVTSSANLKESTAAAGGMLQWDADAARLLQKAPRSRQHQFCQRVERHAQSHGQSHVTLEMVFDARPDADALYPVPRLFAYNAHLGPVTGLQCSPFHRAAFLSCGADGTARVHSALHTRAVLTLEPVLDGALTAAAWSNARPLVLAVACSRGQVSVFDLGASTMAPVAQLQVPQEGGPLSTAACALAFNPKQRAFIAAGCNDGTVLLWQLGWGLSNMRQGEMEALEQLCYNTDVLALQKNLQ
ncbi:WD40-repeat-containing domain protein [Tribonema minus]|uniref:WD40-repeat-containing domain protein n=1 Tax=Tribonema minus TaxID=303371 RepID=A0A835ZBI6_9STRA|nr:WD40-repeat-containing domain protein [Tribonema minus]